MRTWKDEKTGIRMCEPDSCDEWLTLLWMVGADYDGCNTVDSLKALVDELVDMALKAQRCLDEEHSTRAPRLVRSTGEHNCLSPESDFIVCHADGLKSRSTRSASPISSLEQMSST